MLNKKNRTIESNIVISQDFAPMIGGAHLWLYEVYRRWPSTFVNVLTENCTMDKDQAQRQIAFDLQDNGKIQIIRKDIHIEQIRLANIDLWKKYLKILNIMKSIDKDGYTYLHCLRAFPEGFSGALYKNFVSKKAKLIVYAHGEEILITNTSRQLRWLAKHVYKNADLIIANSENTKKLIHSLCSNSHIACIHPGVNVGDYQKPKSETDEFRSKWNWPEETVIICTIARMEPRKNHATVLRAIANLRGKGHPVAYVCGSEGQEKIKLAKLAEDLNIAQWVHFTGTLSEKDKIMTYAASDIHAMPSIQLNEMIEGFGIVFLEAAAAGIPSICGNSGGQSEAVLNGKTGIIVDGTKLSEVEGAIQLLAENKSLRDEMGNQGRLWAAQNDWEIITQKIFNEVDKLN